METHATPASTAPSALGPLTESAWSSPVSYKVAARWEEFANDEYRQTLITKQVQMRLRPQGDGLAAWLHTTAPQLSRKDAVQPVEQLALRVAALYEHVAVEMTPEGQLTRLLNYSQLRQTWAALRADLLTEADAGDELTRKLVELMEQQMAHEEKVFYSLRHDYTYQTLGQAISTLNTATHRAGATSREFSHFFPHTSLWFTEATTVVSVEQQIHVALHGTLDETKTNVAAIQRLMREALALPAATTAASVPEPVAGPHFGYEASYVAEPATGSLVSLTLTVYARLTQLYNKQYTLTVHRLP